MRYVSEGGKLREKFSDPDASWGHRSAISTRKGGGFYGYTIDLAVCTRRGLPLAWQIRTARHHESLFVAPLLDALHARGFQPERGLIFLSRRALSLWDASSLGRCGRFTSSPAR
jgi:hypothetical protein